MKQRTGAQPLPALPMKPGDLAPAAMLPGALAPAALAPAALAPAALPKGLGDVGERIAKVQSIGRKREPLLFFAFHICNTF